MSVGLNWVGSGHVLCRVASCSRSRVQNSSCLGNAICRSKRSQYVTPHRRLLIVIGVYFVSSEPNRYDTTRPPVATRRSDRRRLSRLSLIRSRRRAANSGERSDTFHSRITFESRCLRGRVFSLQLLQQPGHSLLDQQRPRGTLTSLPARDARPFCRPRLQATATTSRNIRVLRETDRTIMSSAASQTDDRLYQRQRAARKSL
jgi:hypothetical protein